MAIISVQPIPNREKDDLEKIALGLQIATSALQIPFSIAGFIKDARAGKADEQLKKIEAAGKVEALEPVRKTEMVPQAEDPISAALTTRRDGLIGVTRLKPQEGPGVMALPDVFPSQHEAGVRFKAIKDDTAAIMKRLQMSKLAEDQAPLTDVQKKWLEGIEPGSSVSIRTQGQLAKNLLPIMSFALQKGKEEKRVAKEERELDLTPGQLAIDKAFAKDYSEFVAGGGFADARKNIDQLKDVRDKLKEGKSNYTGPIIGSVPKRIRTITNPKSVSMQEAVEEVVQRNLRLVLGAAFTEKEGTRLIERAYNTSLEENENLKRLNRLINQVESAYKAKESAANYFSKNGTLKGWVGTLPAGPQDFLKEERDPDIEAYSKQYNLEYDQAKKIIDRRREASGE